MFEYLPLGLGFLATVLALRSSRTWRPYARGLSRLTPYGWILALLAATSFTLGVGALSSSRRQAARARLESERRRDNVRFLVQRALNAFNAASAAILAATGPSGLSERFVGRRPASVFDGSDVTLELVGRLREREVALGAVSIAPDDTPARRSGLRDAVRENLAEFQRRLAEAWTSTLGSDLAAAEMSLVLEVRDDPFLASLALRCGAPVPSHVIAAVAPLRTVLPPPCPETAGVRALEACEGARQPYLASFRRCLDRFAALASRLGR